MKPRLPLLPLLALLALPPCARADWPQYLGPDRTGSITEGFNAAKWPADGLPAIKWHTRAGNGIASPIIVGDRLYTIGSIKPDANPADGVSLDEMWTEPEMEKALPASSPFYPAIQELITQAGIRSQDKFRYLPVVTHAFCFEAATGKLVWASPISEFEGIYKGEGMNLPRAAPLYADGRLFTMTHAGAIACLDAQSGKALWRSHISKLGSERTYIFGKAGIGGAPFTDGKRVFFTFPVDNNHSSVTAFEPATGGVLWQTKLNTGFRVDLLSAAHALIEGKPTIVVPGGYRTYGLDPADGSTRWTFDAHAQWPEISFDKSKHSATNTVYWADQHPGRHPVIYGDYVVNRVFIWGGHKDQRTYCIKIEHDQPRLVWDKKDLSAWRGLYIRKDNLLLAMDYNHFTSAAPVPEKHLTREPPVYDTERFQCIDIPTGKRLWATNAFTLDSDGRQLTYEHFEPEHIAAGDQVVVMHMSKLGWATFDATGIQVKSVATGHSFWGFSPLVLDGGRLFFQRMAAVNSKKNSFGDQQDNLFCLDLAP